MVDKILSHHKVAMPSSAHTDLNVVYRRYIDTIQGNQLDKLSLYVSDEVVHNGKRLGLQGYKDLILRNIVETSVSIEIKRLVVDARTVAAVLNFSTKAETKELVGYQLDGEPFSYAENVVYDFENGKIVEVFSVFEIDIIRSHART